MLTHKIKQNLLNPDNSQFTSINILPDNSNINEFKKTDDWLYYSLNNVILPKQGFKIHISCTLDNYQRILDIVHIFCIEYGLVYKYIFNLKKLNLLLSSLADRTSGGKFITIYPINENQFIEIMPKLNDLLYKFKGPKIMSDRKYIESNDVLHYRYGIINGNSETLISTPDGRFIQDDRVPYFQLPEFVNDPFPLEIDEPNYIGKTVKVLSAIQLKFSGGIYRGYYNNLPVIIKESRKNTYKLNNIFSNTLKQNERNIINYLSKKFDNIPKFYTDFVEDGNYYLIVEKMPGLTVSKWREIHYMKTKQNSSAKTIVRNLINSLNNFHLQGVCIGDLSQENILIDGENVFFIDLEQAYIVGEKNTSSTFFSNGFYDERLYNLDGFTRDWLQLGYVIISMFSKSHYTLSLIDDHSLTFFYKEAKEIGISDNIINLISYLLNNSEKKNAEIMLKILEHEINVAKNEEHITFKPSNILDAIELSLKESIDNNTISLSSVNKDLINLFHGEIGIRYLLQIPLTENFLKSSLNTNFSEILTVLLKLYSENTQSEYIQEWIEKYEIQLKKNIYKIKSIKNKGAIDGVAYTAILASKLFQKTNQKLYFTIEKISREVLNMFWLKEHKKDTLNFGLYDGIIGYVYYLSLSKTNEFQYENNIYFEKYINFIEKEALTFNDGVYGLKIRKDSSIISPYIHNGLGGLLLSLINFKSKTGTTKYDEFLKIISLNLYQPCQSSSFLYGSSGMGYCSLLLYEIYGDELYLDNIVEVIRHIANHVVMNDKYLYILSPNFKYFSLDVGFGFGGIYYFLERMRKNEKYKKIMEMDVTL